MTETPRRPQVPSNPSEPRQFTEPPLFNPFDAQFHHDPYAHYTRLRTRDPVHRSPLGVWFVGSYQDVRTIFKDRRFRVQDLSKILHKKNELLAATRGAPREHGCLDHLVSNTRYWLAFLEAPDHTRLRSHVAGALTRNSIELLRPFFRDASRSLVEKQLARGEMDSMKDFARLLPFHAIAHILGIPPDMYPRVQAWTERLTRAVDALNSIEDLVSIEAASRELTAYLRTIIAERVRRPGNDFISMCTERLKDGQLTEQELISLCVFTFVAGLDTMTYFLGNAILALIRHPRQLQHLRENPDILPGAVDELLRFDPPLPMIPRIALEDVEVRGKVIRAGEQVYLAVSSANRDPERFDNPDDLVLERRHNHHMAFGDGHHMCVGAQLARIEAQEALRALLETIPDMRLNTDSLQWTQHLLSRGLTALPVAFSAHQ